MKAFHGARCDCASVEKGDGEVRLGGSRTVAYGPPGTHSTMEGSMVARLRHRVTVSGRPGGWKVTAFESQRVGRRAAR